jgi:hypothetical protein
MSSVQIQISYRDLHLLRRFPQIIEVKNGIMDSAARDELCSELEQKFLQLTGQPNVDLARESMLRHADQPDFLKADLQSNQESAFPEDYQFAIGVTPSQAEIIAEIALLKEIEAIIGRVQFEDFIANCQYPCKVIDPSSQFFVTSESGYEFRQAIIPAEIMRGSMIAYLLGDQEATQSASSLIVAIVKLVGKTWAEITNDVEGSKSPVISSDFSGLDISKVFQTESRFIEIATKVGRRISLLREYRGRGGNIKISDSGQVSLAPNEDGSLKISRAPYPLSDRAFTPDEIAQWHYANQLLGYSPEEKVEVLTFMAEMLESYNKDPKNTKGQEFGQLRQPITSFRDLHEIDCNRAYRICYPLGLSQEQVNRFLDAQSKLSVLISAFEINNVAALFDYQQLEDRSNRIFDLGQVYPCEDKLKITPIEEFRRLPPDEQVARNSMIRQRAEAKRQMLENIN